VQYEGASHFVALVLRHEVAAELDVGFVVRSDTTWLPVLVLDRDARALQELELQLVVAFVLVALGASYEEVARQEEGLDDSRIVVEKEVLVLGMVENLAPADVVGEFRVVVEAVFVASEDFGA